MELNSYSRFVKPISFPEFANRQHYMATTNSENVKLPDHIAVYENEVKTLCDAIGYKGIIHVTIDEKVVSRGCTQRKPELHVDGRFTGTWWGHPGPSWNHFCNEVPLPRMSVAIASSFARCKAYHGVFHGTPSIQGDLSHIRDQVGEGILIPENEWHLLSPDCVHESLPFDQDRQRSFIRVAFEDQVD